MKVRIFFIKKRMAYAFLTTLHNLYNNDGIKFIKDWYDDNNKSQGGQ